MNEILNNERLARNLSVKPITIPHIRRATMGMVAEQYNIPYNALSKKYVKHKDEFENDIVRVTSLKQFEHMLPPEVQFVAERKKGTTNYMFTNAAYATITPCKTILFNEPGIRHLIELACTQEKRGRKPGVKYNKPKDEAVDISKPILKTEFDNSEEEALLVNMAKAYKTGEIMNLLSAALALDTYRQRTIKELQENQDNASVPWTSRASVGRVVNTLSDITGERKCRIWDIFYDRLMNKHNIPLKERNKKPLINGLENKEWHIFYQVFTDICRDKYLDVDRILMKAGVDATGLNVMVKY